MENFSCVQAIEAVMLVGNRFSLDVIHDGV